MATPPTRLFKYCPPERVDVLRSGKIRFTPAKDLNDPFEINAKPDYSQCNAEDADVLRRQSQEVRGLIAKHWGILSLTTRESNLQMWAHYAAGHRGFLLEFNTSDQFFHPVGRKGGFLGPFPVKYGSEPPNCDHMQLDAYLHKGIDWSSEDEWRMFNSDADYAEKWGNVHLFELPATAIKAIYLGNLVSEELKKDWAKFISNDSRYQHVQLFNSDIQRETHSIEHYQIAGPREPKPSNVIGPRQEQK